MRQSKRFSIVIALAPWRSAEILPFINKQDYPKKNFEIIIEKGLNVPNNRENGAKRAKGEIIVFLDDDAIIEKDYLKKIDYFFKENPEIDILGGPQLTPKSDGIFARANGYVLASIFASVGARKRYKKAKFTLNANSDHITGANLICRNKVLKSVKFDPEVYPADDLNFVEEARKKGFKVAYSPDIFIYHRRRADLKGLVKQVFDYARERPKKNFFTNIVCKPLITVPSLFFMYNSVIAFLFLLNGLFILPFFLYIVLNLLFSFYEVIRNRDFFALFILPFLFLTVHIAYGFGFIIGLIDKIFK